MAIKTVRTMLAGVALSTLAMTANAAVINKEMARMQAMDKITGMVRVVNIPVNSEVKFGSFSIVVRTCKTTPPEETPENYAFVDVIDNFDKPEERVNIFKGWMMSSSPALNSIAHPIYDVWLLQCIDGKIDGLKYLTEDELKARDAVPQSEKSVDSQKFGDMDQEPGFEDEPVVETQVVVEEEITPAETQPMDTENAAVEVNAVEYVSTGVVVDPQAESGPKSLINIQEVEQTAQPAIDEQPVQEVMEPTAVLPGAPAPVDSQVEFNAAPEDVVIVNEQVQQEVMPVAESEVLSVSDYELSETNQAQQTESLNDPFLNTDHEAEAAIEQRQEIQPLIDAFGYDTEEIEENGMLDEQLIDFSDVE